MFFYNTFNANNTMERYYCDNLSFNKYSFVKNIDVDTLSLQVNAYKGYYTRPIGRLSYKSRKAIDINKEYKEK